MSLGNGTDVLELSPQGYRVMHPLVIENMSHYGSGQYTQVRWQIIEGPAGQAVAKWTYMCWALRCQCDLGPCRMLVCQLLSKDKSRWEPRDLVYFTTSSALGRGRGINLQVGDIAM